MPKVKSEQARAEVLVRERVIGAVGEAGVVDPYHARVAAQEFGGAARVLDVALDAQGDGLDSLQQQKGGERREHGARRALIDAAAARDIGGVAEMLGVDEAVIRGVRLVEHRKAARMRLPGKATAVDDRAAEGGAVSASIGRSKSSQASG